MDNLLQPVRPSSISDFQFDFNRLREWAEEITNEPQRVDQVYAEIEAMRRAELAAEQQSQARIDALAESVPGDLVQYSPRKV